MEANKEQSFDTRIRVSVPVIGVERDLRYDMKDPEYRGMYQYY